MTRTLVLEEAAKVLHICEATAQSLAKAGKLPGAKIGRAWVFLEDDVYAYLRSEVARQVKERSANDDAPTETQIKRIRPNRRKKRPLPVLPEAE